jgi:hypothetical protein
MSAQTYQQLILEGIKGLPPEILAEILDFVYFVRRRVLQPDLFEEEVQQLVELKQLSRQETTHLEQEFENYDHQ